MIHLFDLRLNPTFKPQINNLRKLDPSFVFRYEVHTRLEMTRLVSVGRG